MKYSCPDGIAMKRIRCPIHNYITLDPKALSIVDLPIFQRLHGIKQLGMAYLVYPGAHHSRFEHSLGVYHLGATVSRMLNLPEYDTNIITLSGLLHDIGHGPLSHIMESIGGTTHEERSASMILQGKIADSLTSFGVEPKEIAETILGRSYFSPLISSEIDIDRMDYLLRDAHYTGVSTALDSGRLTAVMELDDNQLIFREAGLGAVEALLLARFMMYPYVYYHHTARSAERMISRAIEISLEHGFTIRNEKKNRNGNHDEDINGDFNGDLIGNPIGNLNENLNGDIGIEDLWLMDDIDLVSYLRHSNTPAAGIMKDIDGRKLYKRGWEQSLSHLLGDDHMKVPPSAEFTDPSSEDILQGLRHTLTKERIREIETDIAGHLKIPPECVIVDCPLPPSLNTKRIIIRLQSGERVPARSLSQIISIMEKAQLDHWKFRVFVPNSARTQARTVIDDVISTHLDL